MPRIEIEGPDRFDCGRHRTAETPAAFPPPSGRERGRAA